MEQTFQENGAGAATSRIGEINPMTSPPTPLFKQGVFILKNAIAIFKKNHKIFPSNSLGFSSDKLEILRMNNFYIY
jgi:hypothetical protein